MKSIKRTRGVSHKKRKVTDAVIKLENAQIKNALLSRKKTKIRSTLTSSASSTPLSSPNISPPTDDAVTEDGATEDAITEVDDATPVVIDSSFNFPKNKVKRLLLYPRTR